ncbi:MAG: NAD(P)-dependent oxidoreductase [Verrucomicrobiota bacterium]|jgi:D-3-phosphoglycerate dehydrogenase
MSNRSILITGDVLSKQNEQQLESAGFEVRRISSRSTVEDELIAALKESTGYILGGNETVTEKVIKNANALQAIVYTSTSFRLYIPAYETATRRGIAIANCPGGDAAATAEYALALILAMVRNIFDVGRTGSLTEFQACSIDTLRVGIVGLGAIGTSLAVLLGRLGVGELCYYSRTKREALESALRIQYRPKHELLSSCNVITLHTPRAAGMILGEQDLARIPNDGLIINTSYPDAVDSRALIKEIKGGRLRAAFDFPPNDDFRAACTIQPSRFFWSNDYAGYNTTSALRIIGDMATASMINLLTKGTDRHLVNPAYSQFRQDTSKYRVL